jgi:YidC/Oxa1 family membrane protein insertase
MSSRPAPRSNFLQILLITALIFMGIQLFMGPQRTADPRSADQIWTSLQQMNRDLKDVSIQSEFMKWERKYTDTAKANKVPESEIQDKILAGALLVADTKFKSGLYRDQLFKEGKATQNYAFAKITRAYDFLKPRFETNYTLPRWKNVEVAVTPFGPLTATTITPDSLYNSLVADLSPRNKAEPVFGFIPGYQFIDALVKLTGSAPGFSYAFACFILALIVRAIIWPLAQKQLMWGRQMQQLQPMIKELEAKHKDPKTKQVRDQNAYSQEVFGLYGKYGINPFAGCWPALIQLPLFLTVYQCMLHYKFEFTKGVFAWINPSSTTFLGIPIAPNLGEKDMILIAIYGVTMILATFTTPVSDITQAKQQRLLGLSIAVIFSISMFFISIPSAFVLYWTFTNILSTAQSFIAYRLLPAPPLVEVSTTVGGKVAKKSKFMELMEQAQRQAQEQENQKQSLKNSNKTIEGEAVDKDGKAKRNGNVDSSFFGKSGTQKGNKKKKK